MGSARDPERLVRHGCRALAARVRAARPRSAGGYESLTFSWSSRSSASLGSTSDPDEYGDDRFHSGPLISGPNRSSLPFDRTGGDDAHRGRLSEAPRDAAASRTIKTGESVRSGRAWRHPSLVVRSARALQSFFEGHRQRRYVLCSTMRFGRQPELQLEPSGLRGEPLGRRVVNSRSTMTPGGGVLSRPRPTVLAAAPARPLTPFQKIAAMPWPRRYTWSPGVSNVPRRISYVRIIIIRAPVAPMDAPRMPGR